MPRALAVLTLACCLAMGACVPPEAEDDLDKRWDSSTVMGVLQEKGVLRVGLSPDSPTAIGGEPGAYDLLGLDFARYLAEKLGIDVEIVEVPASQLQTGLDAEDINIAFPLRPITEKTVRTESFSDPILVSHQRLLVGSGSGITGPDDLEGLKVCVVFDPETGLNLSDVDPTIEVTRERDPEGCVRSFANGEAAGVTAPDVVLLRVAQELEELCASQGSGAMCDFTNAEITGDQLTTQGYGALLERGASGWNDFVNLVLERWIEEGGWETSYVEHFGAAFSDAPEPPRLTVEEVAALFPSN